MTRRTPRRFLVTGGAGFIGSAVARHLISATDHDVLVLDKLTYAANPASLTPIAENTRYGFVEADIADLPRMREILGSYQPDVIMNLAAESHVDRSIDGPEAFIRTNIEGTYALLEAALSHWRSLPADRAAGFRFHHISTDEVFGSLGSEGVFVETSPYRPNSPYAASKAASDHLVRAWWATYELPTVLSNSSNNYGPCQFPEKLIPLTILNAMEGARLPVYGRGENIRDWLHVNDHARALVTIAEAGRPGESYNVGGDAERRNIDVVLRICALMDSMLPNPGIGPREKLIDFVDDRPGHDFRYSIDSSKIRSELGWSPSETFESGLAGTVRWYLDNPDWWGPLRRSVYAGNRLGLA